ncbi:MARCKS-related protein [Heterocephalus glaber]|uniref:MARCKS-related protein n=1 Tax=Heterocephalus glaber TaxID=10181 RepID=G5C2A5_HETGA|nr:MARCKS-related protein [Heterocephalus glaber]
MLTQFSLSRPKFQIIPDVPEKLASAQAQENQLVEDQHEGRRLRTVDRVLKGPKGIRKRLLEERQKQKVRGKRSTQPLAENSADRRSLRSPSTGKPGQNEGVLGPRHPLRAAQKVPMSSALQDALLHRLATAGLAKAHMGQETEPKTSPTAFGFQKRPVGQKTKRQHPLWREPGAAPHTAQQTPIVGSQSSKAPRGDVTAKEAAGASSAKANGQENGHVNSNGDLSPKGEGELPLVNGTDEAAGATGDAF